MGTETLREVRARGCLSYWFPTIERLGLPVPRTVIVKTDSYGYEAFLADMREAVQAIGLPCFLRTGLTSAKHYWKNTCLLAELDDLPRHITKIVEFSECADLWGLDTSVWVVRELLPVWSAFSAFAGDMPITIARRSLSSVPDAGAMCG